MTLQSWPLRGQVILLVGGPVSAEDDHFAREEQTDALDDEADVRVEESALALARGVFARGGQILCREDVSLTPLLLEAAFEYWEALPGEESSEDLEHRRFDVTPLVVVRAPRGLVLGDDKDVSADLDRAARIGCLQHITLEQVDDVPIAFVVCIGGAGNLSGQLEPYARVRRERVPIYVIPSTGGAASRAVTTARPDAFVIDIEQSLVEKIQSQRRYMRFELPPGTRTIEDERARGKERFDEHAIEEEIPDFQYAFYPLLIAALLDERRR